MRNRVGVAVWGAGFASDFHVKGWQNVRLRGYDVEVVAVINRTKSKAETLMQKYGVENHFHDLGQLLDSEPVEYYALLAIWFLPGCLLRRFLV